ncbi:MAG: type II toxin-antitoxin system HigB family toxin [Rhodocyclaceae bacterium]|nr:type II toxin-antitoxin system HigB family toxin [Rhodocyclaceae bacterium]
MPQCNKALRDFARIHPEADAPLQVFRLLIERGKFSNFAELRATFRGVDKVGERYIFNIGGNKYRLVAAIAFAPQLLWVKAVMTHSEYDKGEWK